MTRVPFLTLQKRQDRSTLQRDDWTKERLEAHGLPVIPVRGLPLRCDAMTPTGKIFQPHARAHWSLTQIARLTQMLAAGEITWQDTILIDDMTAPGYSALPYIFGQLEGPRPRIYAWVHANTPDPDDFMHPMRRWARLDELVVGRTVDGFLVATAGLAEQLRVAMFEAPVYVLGLPFGREEVRSRVPVRKPLGERPKLIVYSSRYDTEKQPWFWMDLVEHSGLAEEGWEFAVLAGADELRSDDPKMVERARELQRRGLLRIHEGLLKNRYYELLADARAHVNTARQDWISYGVIEASALGTPSLCPSFRSFPETLNGNPRQLYTPWNFRDAGDRLRSLLADPPDEATISHVADENHKTLDKLAEVLTGRGEGYRYEGPRRDQAWGYAPEMGGGVK